MANLNELYPTRNVENITPNDSTEFNRCRCVLLGVAGDLAIQNEDGTTTTIVGLAAGIWHPMSTKKILATGTTATNICVGR